MGAENAYRGGGAGGGVGRTQPRAGRWFFEREVMRGMYL